MSPLMEKPTEVVNPHVDSYCWHPDGWEAAGEFTVHDARKTTRGKAAAMFAREFYGDITAVRVWKRYVRQWTRQDVWDYEGRDQWEQRNELDYDAGPEEPPANWQPDEESPVWEFVRRDHPDAVPVWICGVKGDRAPQNPGVASREPQAPTEETR